MRTFIFAVFLLVLLTGGVVGSWVAMNYFSPGSLGTPAHAGAVSNGRPEECTNVNFQVKARSEAKQVLSLESNWLVRGTYDAEGGWGAVDILMRIVGPQGDAMFDAPRATNFDFTFPVKLRGDYTLVFDNRYSLYTSKAVGLYYCIDKGIPPTPVR